MIKKIVGAVFSMKLMAILIVGLLVAVAVATFIENDFGAVAAKATVYNTKWFELIMLLLVINLVGNVILNKNNFKGKFPVLLFHLAFIVILLGAFITRYFGEEAYLHIRENEQSNQILTNETFINIDVDFGTMKHAKSTKVLLSPVSKKNFSSTFKNNTQKIEFRSVDYIPNANYQLKSNLSGSAYIQIVVPSTKGRREEFVKEGSTTYIEKSSISFESSDTLADVQVNMSRGRLTIQSADSMTIRDNSIEKVLEPGVEHPFNPQIVYEHKGELFFLNDFKAKALPELIASEDESRPDAVMLNVKVDEVSEEIIVWGKKDVHAYKETLGELNGLRYKITYGSNYKELPFSLRLSDFRLTRYPGSNSPSSFESSVVLIDAQKNVYENKEVFMNNVLKYRGFRFYQSSYDKDEQGTILSVNKDFLGTSFTYVGYLLLAIGMFLSLFSKNSRFQFLKGITKPLAILIVTLSSTLAVYAGDGDWQTEVAQNTINEQHAREFGKLLIQDNQGRVKPLNSLSSQVLRKVSRKTMIRGLSSDQVFLGMMVNPEFWQNVPMIKIAHSGIEEILGVESNYVSFNDVFTLNNSNSYQLGSFVEEAYRKKPAYRSKLDNELIRVDERINICYVIYTYSLLKIYPIPNDKDNKWVSPVNNIAQLSSMDSIFINKFIYIYLDELKKSLSTNNYDTANEYLDYISGYQYKYGEEIMPSAKKQEFELWYNKLGIFDRLSNVYGLLGFILLILNLIAILSGKFNPSKINRIGFWIVLIPFVMHAMGLALRWYISGHAPWSNGYEALIYISWTGLLAGFIFSSKSPLSVPVTAMLSYLILHVAHLSWMDPEITNLVPVLKSVWLLIHVAIITSSYGFLALGALLALVNLILLNFMSAQNKDAVYTQVSLLTNIIEMTVIIGLYMLTVGTFLGGVWANESWGRYWGWDPKEAWALVTVLVYVFIVHMRFIPGLRGVFAFNVMSLFGFSSVIMTYFGVNFYLSGLHSYAKGDPLPFPEFIIYTLLVLGVISIVAFINNRRFVINLAQSTQKDS